MKRIALVAALLIGCNRAPAPVEGDRRAIVFTTLYPLADLARQVGGEHVRVDWLLDLGDPIDQFAMTRRDAERFSGTDFILCDGLDRTEIWARADLDRFRNTSRLISVDQTTAPNEVPADGLLCLDPVLAGRTAILLADGLGRQFPKLTDDVHTRAAAFNKDLNTALAGFAVPKTAHVVVLSNLFQPLLARLGVKQVLVPADPLHLQRTDAESIRRAAESAGARSLIVPFGTPPGTVTSLEEQTGLKAVALDALGYPNYGQHASYLDVLKFNLDQLRIATR